MLIFYSYYFLNFVYFICLCWVFIAARRISLIAVSGVGGYSPVAVCRLHIAVASLNAKHRLWGMGSVDVHRLSCPVAWGIFQGQGLNPCSLHWQADSYPLDYQRGP